MIPSCESGRVDDAHKILLNEPTGIAGLTRTGAKRILKICQGALASRQFDKQPPSGCGQVNPWDPMPLEREQRSERHENHECEVKCNYHLSGNAVQHGLNLDA